MPHGMQPPDDPDYALPADIRQLHTEIRGYMEPQLEKMNVWLNREGEALVTEARACIVRAQHRNEKVGGLAMAVRHRPGQWGPRIVWIRLGRPLDEVGAKRAATDGAVPRATRELPMPTGIWAHLNTFRRLPEPLSTELLAIEMRARRLRKIVLKYRRIALSLNAPVEAEVDDLPRRRIRRQGGGDAE